jgi:hypothetical protein
MACPRERRESAQALHRRSFRYNSTFGLPEFADGVTWRQPISLSLSLPGFRNLVITNDATTPNSKVSLSADAVTAETTAGVAFRSGALALTIDAGVVGANGIDAAALTNNAWFSAWVIYNPTSDTWAGLLSTSTTAPTMPAGYTAKARFGWVRTNGSAQIKRFIQRGRIVQYIVGTNPAVAPLVAQGVTGSTDTASPTLTSTSVATFVPTTAARVQLTLANANGLGSGGPGSGLVAPNTSWGGANNGISGSNGNAFPLTVMGGTTSVANAWLTLEATQTVGFAASANNVVLVCNGWEDNI